MAITTTTTTAIIITTTTTQAEATMAVSTEVAITAALMAVVVGIIEF